MTKKPMRLPLSKNQFALVDAEDFPALNRWSWSATWAQKTHGYYAKRKEGRTSVLLHRQIMKAKKGQRIDFANGDTLDCRKTNLRKCTRSQDAANKGISKVNTTGYKGVIAPTGRHRWRANIGINGKCVKLGSFDSAKEAAKAYDAAARKQFGKFARLNFPRGKEKSALTPDRVPGEGL